MRTTRRRLMAHARPAVSPAAQCSHRMEDFTGACSIEYSRLLETSQDRSNHNIWIYVHKMCLRFAPETVGNNVISLSYSNRIYNYVKVQSMQTLAKKLLEDLEALGLSECNPNENIQTLWAKFKADVSAYEQHCSRFITNERTRQIRTWKAQLSMVLHDDDISQEDRSIAAYLLEKKFQTASERNRRGRVHFLKHGMMLKVKHCEQPHGHARLTDIRLKNRHVSSR
jgi:predicted transcriptional regulator